MQAILKALQKGTEASHGQPQSLLFREAVNPTVWQKIAESPFYQQDVQEVYEYGEKLLQEPMPHLSFTLYKQFDTTGERVGYQEVYFRRRLRLNVFTVLSLLDQKTEYINALEDILWSICDEYSWCLPAHMGGESLSVEIDDDLSGTFARQQTLDLFACETAFYLSEISHLLRNRLSPLIVHRIRHEVVQRVLQPYARLGASYWWETTDMNWAAVCGGSIGAAAMYLYDDDNMLYPIIYRVLSTMESYLAGFHADGACLEGIGYWNYGFGFYVYFAALLKQRTAGAIDLLNSSHVKEIALFQQKSYMHNHRVISYSDAPQTYRYQLGLTHYLNAVFEEVEVPDPSFRVGLIDNDQCFRFAPYIRNLVWSDPAKQGGPWTMTSYMMEDAGIYVGRFKTDHGAIVVSAKGGHNDEPHNHNDLGSFILYADGHAFLVDPGAGVYTKQYFGEQRYEFIHTGSQGHSVPILEREVQRAGRQFQASLVHSSFSDEIDEIALDLTTAYAYERLTKFYRRFQFNKRERSLHLTDQFEFADQPTSIVERFVTFIKPKFIAPGTVRIQANDAKFVDLTYRAEQIKVELHSEPFLPGDQERDTLYLIDLHVLNPRLREQVEVNFVLHL